MRLRSRADRCPADQGAPDVGSAEHLLRIERDLAMMLGSTSDLSEGFNSVLCAALKTGEFDSGGIYVHDEASGELRLVTHRGVRQRLAEAVRCYPPKAPATRRVLRGKPFYGNTKTMRVPRPELLEEGLKALAVLPSKHQGRVVAVMALASHTQDEIASGRRDALEGIAAQIGPFLRRVRAESSLREGLVRDVAERRQAAETLQKEQQLLKGLLELQDRDRRLLAYEIHDGCVQQLSGALMHFQGFQEQLRRQPEEAWRYFETGAAALREGIAELRHLIGGLRPPILDDSGAVAAIEYLVCQVRERGKAEITFDAEVQGARLTPAAENALFRAVQEALSNAFRHSDSPRVAVRVWESPDRVCAEVRDWGRGFNPAAVPHGRFGLQGIRERTRLVGGSAVIESAPGQGTRVRIDLPRAPDNLPT